MKSKKKMKTERETQNFHKTLLFPLKGSSNPYLCIVAPREVSFVGRQIGSTASGAPDNPLLWFPHSFIQCKVDDCSRVALHTSSSSPPLSGSSYDECSFFFYEYDNEIAVQI